MSGDVTSPARDASGPVSRFLEDITYHGKTTRTRDAYERVLRDFESFCADPDRNPAEEPTPLSAATRRECMAYVHELRADRAESTVATYASYLHRFYSYMTRAGEFDDNPMALVVEEMDESIDADPVRRELSVSQMREFVDSIAHPLARAVVVTMLKTGLRAGELCNLDRRDLHLVDVDTAATDGTAVRPELQAHPDSLYVPAEPAREEVYNGERRRASNKRKRATVVPVDEELKRTLEGWLAVRPNPVSVADPLFMSTADRWGERLSTSMVFHVVAERARERGWYDDGAGAATNVTPHYFRHFFTTHLRDRTGDRGVVKYLRGDVASDVIDTYTHNWGDRVRTVYERHVYSVT